jgi:thiamine biosynthesis protein ThiI
LFVPKNPSTNPNLNVVQKVESFVPRLDEMIAEAVASVQTIVLQPEQTVTVMEQVGEEDWF